MSTDDQRRKPRLRRSVGTTSEAASSYEPRQRQTVLVEPEEVNLLLAAADELPAERRPSVHVFPRTIEGVVAAIEAHGQTARETIIVLGHSAVKPKPEAWEDQARIALAAGKFVALVTAPEGLDTNEFNAAFSRQLMARNPEQ